MKKTFLILSLLICQIFAFAQDNKVMKIAKYISKDKWNDARELLDELDNIPKYKNDIDYWFVRTCYYKAAIATHINSDKDLYKIEIIEAKKSFEKLVEFDKTDTSKSYSEYIPQFRKEIYSGQDETINKSSNTSQSESSKSADNGKTVTLTEIGQGKTKEAAKYSALRSALEKAFGTFISSNTTIFKDELAKDEIVSVSSGNIQNFEILSETQMPDGSFSSVVKATLSIERLTTFCVNKGIAVEFKGGLFAANIKLQELNEKNEEVVLANLYNILKKIISNGFDYTIAVTDPKKYYYAEGYWLVDITVNAKFNNNMNNLNKIIENTFKGISLSYSEVSNYRSQDINVYYLYFNGSEYRFRTNSAEFYLKNLTTIFIPLKSLDFKISNGISEKKWREFSSCVQETTNSGYHELREENYIGSSCEYVPCRKGLFKSNYTIHGVDSDGLGCGGYSLYLGDVINGRNQKEILESPIKTTSGCKPTFDFSKIAENIISFNFSNFLSTENISKITEYKVEPIK